MTLEGYSSDFVLQEFARCFLGCVITTSEGDDN